MRQKYGNSETLRCLGSIMRGNDNDLSWVKYLKRVQYQKNTTHYSTLGHTPYEALFNHKTSSGLLDFGIPEEVANDIITGEDLECINNSMNATDSNDDANDVIHPFISSDSHYPDYYYLPQAEHEPLMQVNTSSPSSPVRPVSSRPSDTSARQIRWFGGYNTKYFPLATKKYSLLA